ncbi:MAG: hypothetical protein HDR80_08550, partial [Bacteroides sp.]|nr:hypothetical protein [Bacteroides sp.]
LMRFGAVDQVVKNAMLTTEDGAHWYFINYDNDTVIGLRNDGLLIYPPIIDRQTLDTSFSTEVYAYAGHDSRLWNMLEADTEFMSIVKEVDQALYSAGLSYANVIAMFDDEQSGKWCERIYNQDAQYKYIGPFTDRGVNNLFMVQGSRQSHRRWWLSERFALLDAKWVSGEYKANSFEVKLAGAPIGLTFLISAAIKTYYGYGVNNVPVQYGIELSKGDTHTFTTTSVLNVGDPLRIYAAPYLEGIDVSEFAPYLTQISIASVYSERLGTKLRSLKLGKAGVSNTALTELSGINQAVGLRHLDVTGYENLLTLDLSRNTQLESLMAFDSGLTSVILPAGAPVSSLKLPASLQSLSLESLYSLEDSGLMIQDNGSNLTSIRIVDCPQIDTLTLVEDWLVYKTAEDEDCSLELNGINWSNVDAAWLIRLGNLKNRGLSLKGTVAVNLSDTPELAESQLTELQQIFGKNCFTPGSELYISVPAGIYIIGPTELRGLQSARYEVVVTSDVPGTTTLKVESTGYSEIYVSFEDGLLILGDVPTNGQIKLLAQFIPDEGLSVVKRITVNVVAIKYPSTVTAPQGRTDITKKGTYEYTAAIGSHDSDADYNVEWSITGDAVTRGLVTLGETTETSAKIIVNSMEESSFNLYCEVKKTNGSKLAKSYRAVNMLAGDVIITASDNPYIMSICYKQGWAAHSNYMTAAEASAVLEVGTSFQSTSATTFNELIHFINIDASMSFSNSRLAEITFPFVEVEQLSITLPTGTVLRSYDGTPTYNFPNLEKITSAFSGIPYVSNLNSPDDVVFNFPKLKEAGRLLCSATGQFHSYGGIYNFPVLEKCREIGRVYNEVVIFPALKEINNIMTGTAYDPIISGMSSSETKRILLPELEVVTGATGQYGGLFYGTFNLLQDISIPKLKLSPDQEIASGYTGGSVPYLFNMTANSLETLNLPVLEQLRVCKLESTSLTTIDAPKLKYLSGNLTGCTALEELNAPGLEMLDCKLPGSFAKEQMVFPRLKFIGGNTNNLLINCKVLDAPELVSLPTSFQFGAPEEVSSINLPKFTGDIDKRFNGLSLLTELILPASSRISSDFRAAPSIRKIETNGNYVQLYEAEGLETLVSPNATYFWLQDLPKLKGIASEKVTGTNNGVSVVRCPLLVEAEFPACTSIYADTTASTAFLGNIKVLKVSKTEPVTIGNRGAMLPNIEVLEGCITNIARASAITSTKLRELRLYSPDVFVTSGTVGEYIGSEVEEGMEKVIHVPEDSTVYDDNAFILSLCEIGFTLVKDLPNPTTEESEETEE